MYLSLRYCAYLATHSGGSEGSVGGGSKGSTVATGTFSRTVSGIPGNNGIAISTHEHDNFFYINIMDN